MDLALYGRVLWRHKLIVAAGLVLATALAALAVFTPSFSHGLRLEHRQGQRWASTSTMLVTQAGFPWGRAVPQNVPATRGSSAVVPASDPQRLSSLAALYAKLAMGDEVKQGLTGSERDGTVAVAAMPAPPYSTPAILPLLRLRGEAPTPARARALTAAATDGFRVWLGLQQDQAGIARSDRVIVQTVNRATPAKLVVGRSKTLPVLIFLIVMAATLAIVLVLENLRRGRAAAEERVAGPAAVAPALIGDDEDEEARARAAAGSSAVAVG